MSSATMASADAARDDLYGVVAEFGTVEEIITAAERVREAGYTRTDAYTPFPVEGLDDALGMRPTHLGWVVLVMGIPGGLGGGCRRWWAEPRYYPPHTGG